MRRASPETGSSAGGRLRILHLVLTIGETSAPYNEHCLAMAGRHEISVCSYFVPTVKPAGEVRVFAGDSSIPGFLKAQRRALRAGPYDVVHSHAPHVGLGLLADSLFRLKRPRAVTVFTVHTSYPNIKPRNRLMMSPVFLCFDQIVCCSHSSLESLPRPFRRLAGDRITVVQNGVDIERVDRLLREKRVAETERRFTVTVVGRLMAIKNPLVQVRAFREGADGASRLVFIGDGPMYETVQDLCRSWGLLEQVVLTGLIPREAVYERLMATDLFVSASTVEGLPVSVLEAMACGCPVVLSDIAPHREIAGGAAFIPLVRPDDVAGWATALGDLLEDAGARARLATAGRQRAERYTWAANAAGLADLYHRAV